MLTYVVIGAHTDKIHLYVTMLHVYDQRNHNLCSFESMPTSSCFFPLTNDLNSVNVSVIFIGTCKVVRIIQLTMQGFKFSVDQ